MFVRRKYCVSSHKTKAHKYNSLLDSFERCVCTEKDTDSYLRGIINRNSSYLVAKSSDLSVGMRIVQKMFFYLSLYDTHDIKNALSVHQKLIHRHIISSSLHLIFGDLYFDNKEYILNTFSLQEENPNSAGVLGTAPRQFGKTTLVSVIAAVMLLCIPNVYIAFINQKLGTSGKKVGVISKIRIVLVRLKEDHLFKITDKLICFKDSGNNAKIESHSIKSAEG